MFNRNWKHWPGREIAKTMFLTRKFEMEMTAPFYPSNLRNRAATQILAQASIVLDNTF